MKKPDYVPQTPRETLEAHRRILKGKAGEPDMKKALLEPTWAIGEAPGTEVRHIAHLVVFPLSPPKTTSAHQKLPPMGAARISWSLVSEQANDLVAGGGAATMEDAKEYAYLAYQAAHGFIRGGDA